MDLLFFFSGIHQFASLGSKIENDQTVFCAQHQKKIDWQVNLVREPEANLRVGRPILAFQKKHSVLLQISEIIHELIIFFQRHSSVRFARVKDRK
jgi:hypothetical protein